MAAWKRLDLEALLLRGARGVGVGDLSEAVVVEPALLLLAEGEHGGVSRGRAPRGPLHARHLVVVGEGAPGDTRQTPAVQAAARLRRQRAAIGDEAQGGVARQ